MNDDSTVDICQNDQSLEDKLVNICHELDLALKWNRPSFLFVIYDTETTRNFAQDSLEAHLQQTNQTVIHYQVECQKQIELIQFVKDIAGPVLEPGLLKKNKDVFFIRSALVVDDEPQAANLISIMNSCRGFLVDNLVRVVFWLTENEALKVAHQAPDFWASRHRVFEFFNVQPEVFSGSIPMRESGLSHDQPFAAPIPSWNRDDPIALSDEDLQVESPLVIDFSEEEEPTFSGINLLLMLGVANWKEGNQEKALEPLQAALGLAQKSGNMAHQTMCHKAIALVHSESGRTDEAIRAYQNVIAIGSENVTIWNNLGLLYLKAANITEALKAFTNAIKLNPNDPVSWYGLGNIHSSNGRMEEAINCYRKAIQFNSSYVAPWIKLADVLAKQARFDDALYAYMRIVEMDKKNVRAWSEIGSIYFKAGSFEQSIDAYKKALMLGDNSPDIHKNLAYAHTQAGNYAEATPLLYKAIELESDANEKAALCNMLGDVYRRVGDYDNAVSAYEMADTQTIQPAVHSTLINQRAATQAKMEYQPEVASEAQLPVVGPQDIPTGHLISSASDVNSGGFPQGFLAEQQLAGDKPEGLGAQENAPAFQPMESLGNKKVPPQLFGSDPVLEPGLSHPVLEPGLSHTQQLNLENANLLVRLANMYLKVGAVDKAIEAFEKSVILDPANGKATFDLGLLYSQKNEFSKAVSFLKLSADLLPENQDKANALNMAGDLYRKLKEYANALGAYEAAFGFDPNNETVMDNLGKIQDDLDQLIQSGSAGNNRQATGLPEGGVAAETPKKSAPLEVNSKVTLGNNDAVDQSIKIDLTNPDVWNELGNIYARSNACDEAIEAYQKAIALNPDFGWSYSNLALVYAFQGKHQEAVSLLEKSIDLLWTDKDKAVAWNRVGDILRQDGKYPAAIAAYQSADRLNQAQVLVSSVHEVNFEHLFSHFIS